MTTPPPFELPMPARVEPRTISYAARALYTPDQMLAAVAERDAWWAAQNEALRADAERYRWLRNCLWNQERNGFTGERSWLWSTRFASGYEQSGDLDCVTQGQELDAAIDARIAEEADAARTKEQT